MDEHLVRGGTPITPTRDSFPSCITWKKLQGWIKYSQQKYNNWDYNYQNSRKLSVETEREKEVNTL